MSTLAATTPEGVRPTKKARLSSNAIDHAASPDPMRKISRSDMFWYDDGDIILETNDGTQYRVHKFMLKLNSCVFRDMFDTVASVQERLTDGCPVVEMQDQKSEWDTMLSVLYKPTEMNPDHEDLTAAALLSMLRLSRKYQFDAILQRALHRLKREFPMTLNKFDLLYEITEFIQKRDHSTACLCGRMMCDLQDVVNIINYAVEWNIKSVLPVAYFFACTELSVEDILDGISGEDSKTLHLNPETQRTLVKGRDALRTAMFDVWFPWLSDRDSDAIISSECGKSSCKDIRRQHIDEDFMTSMSRVSGSDVFKYALQEFPLSNIIRRYGNDADYDDMRSFLCSSCLIMLQKHYDSSRKEIFDYLPAYFSLGTWASLQREAKGDN